MPVASPNPSRSRFIPASQRFVVRTRTYTTTLGRAGAEVLVAPVEVATSAPEVLFSVGGGALEGVLTRPGKHRRPVGDHRLLPVHGLLEPRLLFGLEQGVVVERIVGLVMADRHSLLELRVALLQLEVVLDDLGEKGRCLDRHRGSWLGGGAWLARGIVASCAAFSTEEEKWLRTCHGVGRSLDPGLPTPLGLVQGRIRGGKEPRGDRRGRRA